MEWLGQKRKNEGGAKKIHNLEVMGVEWIPVKGDSVIHNRGIRKSIEGTKKGERFK